MSKINTNKIGGYESIHATRQSDVEQAKKGGLQSVEGKTSVSADKLEFSSSAAEAGKFLEQLKELPDVREDVVSTFRNQILTGKYNPSGDDIAGAILKEEQA